MPGLSIEIGLGFGSEVPVVLQVSRKGTGGWCRVVSDEEGNPHPLLILVDRTSFKNKDSHRGILGKSVGDGEATCACERAMLEQHPRSQLHMRYEPPPTTGFQG